MSENFDFVACLYGIPERKKLVDHSVASRGVLRKDNGWGHILPDLWPIILFAVITLVLGVKRYRQTLD